MPATEVDAVTEAIAGVLPVQADEASQPVLLRQVAGHRAVQLLQGLLRRGRGAQARAQQPGPTQRQQQGGSAPRSVNTAA